MKEVLDQLLLIPGVRLAATISLDGVPICVLEGRRQRPGAEKSTVDEQQAFAAISAAWLDEVSQTLAQLSWNRPSRVVMRGTRGTLVMQRGPGAVLLTVLEHGVAAEELRVPMEGAVKRMERVLRGMSADGGEGQSSENTEGPPAALPSPVRALQDPSLYFAPNPVSESAGES